MTARIFFAVLLVAGAGMAGISGRFALYARPKRICRIADGLYSMADAVRVYTATIGSALSAAAKADPLFSDAAAYMEEGADTALIRAVKKAHLPQAETDILLSLADGLYAMDASSLCRRLTAAAERLYKLSEAAYGEAARLGRLYGGAGFLGGIFLLCIFM